MPRMRLTRSASRRITRDWERCLPGFRAYATRSLGRRVGPLLVGVVLDRDSGGECYYPTAHVHNLAVCQGITDSTVSLTLAERLLIEPARAGGGGGGSQIYVSQHESKHAAAASRLVRQTAIPLEREAKLGEWIAAYQQYINLHPYWEPHALEREMVALCVWCGDTAAAKRLIWAAEQSARAAPNAMAVKLTGGLGPWLSEIRTLPDRREELVETAARQAEFLRVADLPYVEMSK